MLITLRNNKFTTCSLMIRDNKSGLMGYRFAPLTFICLPSGSRGRSSDCQFCHRRPTEGVSSASNNPSPLSRPEGGQVRWLRLLPPSSPTLPAAHPRHGRLAVDAARQGSYHNCLVMLPLVRRQLDEQCHREEGAQPVSVPDDGDYGAAAQHHRLLRASLQSLAYQESAVVSLAILRHFPGAFGAGEVHSVRLYACQHLESAGFVCSHW